MSVEKTKFMTTCKEPLGCKVAIKDCLLEQVMETKVLCETRLTSGMSKEVCLITSRNKWISSEGE